MDVLPQLKTNVELNHFVNNIGTRINNMSDLVIKMFHVQLFYVYDALKRRDTSWCLFSGQLTKTIDFDAIITFSLNEQACF